MLDDLMSFDTDLQILLSLLFKLYNHHVVAIDAHFILDTNTEQFTFEHQQQTFDLNINSIAAGHFEEPYHWTESEW